MFSFSPSALCSLESVSGPAVSIETELALEQLRQKHNQELQQLRIQLETQVLRFTNISASYSTSVLERSLASNHSAGKYIYRYIYSGTVIK